MATATTTSKTPKNPMHTHTFIHRNNARHTARAASPRPKPHHLTLVLPMLLFFLLRSPQKLREHVVARRTRSMVFDQQAAQNKIRTRAHHDVIGHVVPAYYIARETVDVNSFTGMPTYCFWPKPIACKAEYAVQYSSIRKSMCVNLLQKPIAQ